MKLNRILKKELSIFLYKSLKEISAIRFHEIKYEANIYLLDKNYEEGKIYTQIETVEIQNIWNDLYDDWFKRKNDPRFRRSLKKNEETLKILFQISAISNALKNIEQLYDIKDLIGDKIYTDSIDSLGSSLNRLHPNMAYHIDKPIEEQMKRFKSVLGGLETKYQLTFKKEHGIDEDLDILEFYKQKGSMELVLNRNLDEKVNMLMWIVYENQYKDKLDHLKKNSNAK